MASQDSAALQDRVTREKAAVAEGDPTKVITSARSLIALALLQVGTIRAQEQNWSDAADLYRTSLSVEASSDAKAKLDLATSHVTDGSTRQVPRNSDGSRRAAEGRLRTILATGYLDWGSAVAHGGNIAGGRQLFDEASHWDPTLPGVMLDLGLAAFRTGDFEKSSEALALELASKPNDEQARLLLGLSLFSLQKFKEAVQAFTPIEPQLASNPQAAYAFAFSLAHTGELQHSNLVLDKLSARTMPAPELALVCQVYAQNENYEQAVTCLQRALQLDPTLPRMHYQEGVALIRLNRPAAAVPELRKEIEMNGADADVNFYLAYALLQLSQKPEAQELLKAVVSERPDNAQAQYELGKLLLEEGSIPEAIIHLEAATKSAPDDYFAHYQLQNAYRKAGRVQEAAAELKIYRDIKERHRESELQKP